MSIPQRPLATFVSCLLLQKRLLLATTTFTSTTSSLIWALTLSPNELPKPSSGLNSFEAQPSLWATYSRFILVCNTCLVWAFGFFYLICVSFAGAGHYQLSVRKGTVESSFSRRTRPAKVSQRRRAMHRVQTLRSHLSGPGERSSIFFNAYH